MPLSKEASELLSKRFRSMSVDKQIEFAAKIGKSPIYGEYQSKWGLPKGGGNPTTTIKGYMRLEIDGEIVRTARFNDRPTKDRLFAKWNMDTKAIRRFKKVAIYLVHDY